MQNWNKEGMVVEEISSIKKKSRVLYSNTEKDALKVFQKSARPSYFRVKNASVSPSTEN